MRCQGFRGRNAHRSVHQAIEQISAVSAIDEHTVYCAAGIIGAQIHGAAPGVDLISVKVLDDSALGTNAGAVQGVVAAMEHAAANPSKRFAIKCVSEHPARPTCY